MLVKVRAILEPSLDDERFGRDNVRNGILGSGSAWSAQIAGWPGGVAGALWRWRAEASTYLGRSTDSGAALLRGIALGDRRALADSAVEEDFRILGLSHVLAVSGMHLGLVCALVLGLARLMRAPKQVGLLASVSAGIGFVLVTGVPTSAVRALLMVTAGAVAETIGVRRDGLASLSAAVLALIITSPWGVFSIGLQLSVLAVAGLLLFGRWATAWAEACSGPWSRRGAELMSLTCVAQAVTAPVTVPAFQMFSVLAPVANAVVLPCLPFALCSGMVGLILRSAVGGWAGAPLIAVAQGILSAIAWVVARLASLPGAAVMSGGSSAVAGLIAAIGVAVVWIVWPLPRSQRHSRRSALTVVLILIVVAVGLPSGGGASIVVCDVGQGDAILVQDGGQTLLVDTGADGTSLRKALARAGVRRIDAIVLTHAHDDHTGGLAGLIGVAQVGWVGVPCAMDEGARAEIEQTVERLTPRGAVATRSLQAGDRFTVGQCVVEVLWPDATAPLPENTNNTSVVLALHRGSFDAVLTGDAEGEVQDALDETGALEDVEVLKVPHHGSVNGLNERGLSVWSPEVAVISVGEGNRFGHPCEETLELLDQLGVRAYRTDHSGDVTIKIGSHGFRVLTQRVCENRSLAGAGVRAPP